MKSRATNATTGAVNYWVQAPSVSHTSDTTIYLCYGNAAVTTDQSNKIGVWDTNYKAVFHLPNGTTLSGTDSTANGNHATVNSATATAGKIGGSAAGNSSSQNLSAASNSSLNPAANVTVETWVKTTQKSGFLGMVDKYRWESGNNYGYVLDFKAADGKPMTGPKTAHLIHPKVELGFVSCVHEVVGTTLKCSS